MSEAEKDFRCLVCEKTDQWENVDAYRIKPVGMCICKSCGFVTYPQRLKDSTKKLKEFYKKDYRKPPSIANHFSSEKKMHYHKAFLADLFRQWKEEKKNPVVVEIGAAYGFFLQHVIKAAFKEAEIYGTELTKSFVANAWELFKIKLEEEIDLSRNYDLIVSYKVAEHMPDVD